MGCESQRNLAFTDTVASAQHYAARTVENVATQGGAWAARFADGALVTNLVSLWGTAKCASCWPFNAARNNRSHDCEGPQWGPCSRCMDRQLFEV